MVTTKRLKFTCCDTEEVLRIHNNEVPKLVCNKCGGAQVVPSVHMPSAVVPAKEYKPFHGGYAGGC